MHVHGTYVGVKSRYELKYGKAYERGGLFTPRKIYKKVFNHVGITLILIFFLHFFFKSHSTKGYNICENYKDTARVSS